MSPLNYCVLPVCMYVYHMVFGAYRSYKKSSDLLEMELWVIVIYPFVFVHLQKCISLAQVDLKLIIVLPPLILVFWGDKESLNM